MFSIKFQSISVRIIMKNISILKSHSNGKRILILHSSGDSRRLPAYSTIGNIFIPLPISFPTDGFVTLFDILCIRKQRVAIQKRHLLAIWAL